MRGQGADADAITNADVQFNAETHVNADAHCYSEADFNHDHQAIAD
jgi:hypothetical protein